MNESVADDVASMNVLILMGDWYFTSGRSSILYSISRRVCCTQTHVCTNISIRRLEREHKSVYERRVTNSRLVADFIARGILLVSL